METLALRHLTFTYAGADAPALQDVSFSVERGEFFVLCGPSGCGKSTLLRHCKPTLAPHGTREGACFFEGAPLSDLPFSDESSKIGFVQQSPEAQIVTDKVWHELAFGLESLGLPTPAIRRRVAEMTAFFGIEDWFYRDVSTLSGGQKQLLNLASVMAMQPSVLILDEPTSQLDPIAAADFLATLGRVNRELGTTILLTEHRLEDALPLATRCAVLDGGRLLCVDTPRAVGALLKAAGHEMFLAMPAAMRVWAATDSDAPCPVTVREGRAWLSEYAARHELAPLPPETPRVYPKPPAITVDELWFRYEKDAPDVVKGLSLTVERGEFLALLGGNGAGKSTTLRLLAGLLKPQRGDVHTDGRVGLLPQSVQALFVKKTLREDLESLGRGDVAAVSALCRLDGLLERHPFDLSGGEQSRAALAKLLLLQPDLLLLDEPTKGMDAAFKQEFARILRTLSARGVTVVMVSHDVEFCAKYAHRCALFFDGAIAADGTPRAFFSGNSFYTTAANRLAREKLPEAVTAEDVITACGGRLPPEPETAAAATQPVSAPPPRETRLPRWRKCLGGAFGAAAFVLFILLLRGTDLAALTAETGLTCLPAAVLYQMGALLACLAACALLLTKRSARRETLPRRPVTRRALVGALCCVLLIPATLFVGVRCFGSRKYYFISLLILLEAMAPFFLVFEGRKPSARELTLLAALCAIGVAGRAAFFMLPQFKPVLALTILVGVALGGESGFLVGSMTMLVSNLFFSQGPWTPWQMFAMGLCGLLAGVVFRRGDAGRGVLSAFGAACALLYGAILNPAAALLWSQELNAGVLLSYYATGFPMDCIHAAATWLFLWVASDPMLEKLARVRKKYGLTP